MARTGEDIENEEIYCLENITFSNWTWTKENHIEKSLEIIKAFSSTWDEKSFCNNQSNINLDTIDDSFKLLKNVHASRHSQHVSRLDVTNIGNTKHSYVAETEMDMCDWDLPKSIIEKYADKGVKKMFQWQIECLNMPKVLHECGNLVYSAPTSAGKTLVAEILMIKTVLERRKQVIVVLPFVAVVREKTSYFQEIFNESGIKVGGFMGSHSPHGGIKSLHIAVCTIEKANNLVNHMLEEGTISELGAIVIDELHLLGDPHRGYILELMLTKIKYVSKKHENIQIQIVGMSAILPNQELLSAWLEADLHKTDYRPIKLEERCLISNVIYDSKLTNIRNLISNKDILHDKDFMVQLCLETILENCSILIFCSTKKMCENVSQQISRAFEALGYSDSTLKNDLRKQLKKEGIDQVLNKLKLCPVGLDELLKDSISFGVAFHHAGLTFEERDIIECGFKDNIIRVLIATSTLSSGVNLPARRVIVKSPTFNYKPLDVLTYKQMIGRAGRMGMDSEGESILICSEKEKQIGLDLMSGKINDISSCLDGEDKLMRAILEVISTGNASTKEDIESFISCTLIFHSSNIQARKDTEQILKKLTEYELIRSQMNDENLEFVATPLGKACLSSSMSPTDGLQLFIELQKARECFVLETDLHMIYLVTPYTVANQWYKLDWIHYADLWENLDPAKKRVGKLIGIQEYFLYTCIRNPSKINEEKMKSKYQMYKRFYTSLALQDLINEVPLNEVAEKFNCSRGMLQTLQQSAATFAGMVTAFTRQLGWKFFEILVSQFQDRLYFGIQSELLDLMKLKSLNSVRARAIFKAGIESISALANASVNTIENALNLSIPFESEKGRLGETFCDAKKRNKLKKIWITGKEGFTAKDAAKLLITEARIYIQNDTGAKDIQWNSSITSDSVSGIEINQSLLHKSNSQLLENNDSFGGIIDEINKTSNSSNNHNFTQKSKLLHSTPSNDNVIIKPKHDCFTISSDSGNITNDSFLEHSLLENSFSVTNFSENLNSSSNNDMNSCSGTQLKTLDSKDKNESIYDTSKNMSLFEDSFVVDTQFDKMLDDKEQNYIYSNDVKKSEHGDSIVSDRDLLLMEKVFSKPFDKSKSQSLFDTQEEIVNNISNEIYKNKKYISCSQVPTINCFEIPIIRKTRKRKLSQNVEDCIQDEIGSSQTVKMFKHSKLSTMQKLLEKNNMDSIYSKINVPSDIVNAFPELLKISDETNLEYNLFNCCQNFKVFESFISWIQQCKEFSIYVDIQKENQNCTKTIIGNKFRVAPLIDDFKKLKNCRNEDYFINGIGFFTGNNEILFVDLQLDETQELCLNYILDCLKNILNDKSKKVISNECKNVLIKLYLCTGIMINCEWEDISVANWLISNDNSLPSREFSFKKLDDNLCKNQVNTNSKIGMKAWIIWHLMKSMKKTLTNRYPNVLKAFAIEMETLKVLSECELNGIHVEKKITYSVFNQIKSSLELLEMQAYKLAGRNFQLSSKEEVAKVIGIYTKKKNNTKKQVLQEIDSPLSNIIIYWRKLNSILTKNIFPLLEKIRDLPTNDRIYGSYKTYTATGRIIMTEPSLQMTPRNFEIPSTLMNNLTINDSKFSCRSMFNSPPGYYLISADYCQLELRILAHLCNDAELLTTINSGKDVFKMIATKWKKIKIEKVDNELRNKAKTICYAIIYGMGIKSLAQNLNTTEDEAEDLFNEFNKTYPGVDQYKETTVEKCREKGYVETLYGRRRYLPSINSTELLEKSHAERQAVNTTIQGTAADILKSSMISIDKELKQIYRGKKCIKLVLLMHDELIYEVPINELNNFSIIFRKCMENSVKLLVSLPVSIKYGESWGSMKELIMK